MLKAIFNAMNVRRCKNTLRNLH